MRCLRHFQWLAILLMLVSCSPAVTVPVAQTEFTKIVATSQQEYRILAGDQLDIKFYYHPDLNELVTVRPDGRISLQLANEIAVEGLTPKELVAQLKKIYSAEIQKPEITIMVRTFSAQRVYVDGEVFRPGSVVLSNPLTTLQAISLAGGLKDTARVNEVVLMRRGADNRFMATMVDLSKVIDGTDPSQDILLTAYDVVHVPKSPVANVNLWIDQYIRKNIPVPFSTGYSFSEDN